MKYFICFRYYSYLYMNYAPIQSRQLVRQYRNCEDILLNFLVSHLTKFPPIKVTQRKQYREVSLPGNDSEKPSDSEFASVEHFRHRNMCLNSFSQHFGYMPLKRSNMRLDPLLFKDPVSISRKRYRQIELVNS
jgi:glucuronyl/N-acetylglucosaminyl transferase EXT1